jgi:uncharacterized protein HemY
VFWIGITICVLVIVVLTWIGASMTRRGLPNDWESGERRRRTRDQGPIYGPGDHDPYR